MSVDWSELLLTSAAIQTASVTDYQCLSLRWWCRQRGRAQGVKRRGEGIEETVARLEMVVSWEEKLAMVSWLAEEWKGGTENE
jgi:hypothetical protein